MKLTPAQLLVKTEFFLQGALKYTQPAQCPHCRRGRASLVARKAKVVRVVRCDDCGLIYTRPIFRSWLADNFYDRLYVDEQAVTAVPDEARLQHLIATHFQPLDKDGRGRLAAIRTQVTAERPTLLELGTSWGYFLYQAREAGFAPTGIEIGDSRREFGRRRLGLEIVPSWTDLAPGRQFDVIYSSHVLEHFTDLSVVLGALAERLKDDGVMFIEVPNIDVTHLGPSVLSMVGAVHPLGFDSDFFRRHLPKYGLEATGFFDSWADVPHAPQERSHGRMLIFSARKLGRAG